MPGLFGFGMFDSGEDRHSAASREGQKQARNESASDNVLHDLADMIPLPVPRSEEDKIRERAYHRERDLIDQNPAPPATESTGGGGGGGGGFVGGVGGVLASLFFVLLFVLACVPTFFVFWPCLGVSRRTLQTANSVLWKVHPFVTLPLAYVTASYFCAGGGLFNVILATSLLSAALEMIILSKGVFVLTFGAMNYLLYHFAWNESKEHSLFLAVNVWALCGVGLWLLSLLFSARRSPSPSRPLSEWAKTICLVGLLGASSSFLLWNYLKENVHIPRPGVTIASAAFPVTVDYKKTLGEMIKLGKYDRKHGSAQAGPGRNRHDVARVDIVLVCFDRQMQSKDALLELDKMGLRPAALPELLAFGAAYPQQQLAFPIIALNDNAALFCQAGSQKRDLYLNSSVGAYLPNCRFAAVHK